MVPFHDCSRFVVLIGIKNTQVIFNSLIGFHLIGIFNNTSNQIELNCTNWIYAPTIKIWLLHDQWAMKSYPQTWAWWRLSVAKIEAWQKTLCCHNLYTTFELLVCRSKCLHIKQWLWAIGSDFMETYNSIICSTLKKP